MFCVFPTILIFGWIATVSQSLTTSSLCLNGSDPDYDGTYVYNSQIEYHGTESLMWENSDLGKQIFARSFGTFDKEINWQLLDSYNSDSDPYMRCTPATPSYYSFIAAAMNNPIEHINIHRL